MNEINELVETLMIDVAEEGLGATSGIGLLWGTFFAGALFKVFNLLVTLV